MAQTTSEAPVQANAGPQDPEEAKSWRYAKTLLETARMEAKIRTSDFAEAWKFTLGENHWALPESYRAMVATRWQSRTVRNWLWATIDHKAAVCLDADPMIHVEPLTDLVDYATRQKIAYAVKHELERLNWQDRVEDMFFDGAVLGKGLTYLRLKFDESLMQHYICLEQVDPSKFYPDPMATRLRDCKYVVYEPTMDMATVRSIFPEKAHLVKPNIVTDIYQYGDSTGAYSRTDQELVEGTSGNEYAIGKDGKVRTRKCDVAYIWIKDESVLEEVKINIVKDATDGLECQECGSQFEMEEVQMGVGPSGQMVNICPECGSSSMRGVALSAVTESQKENRRAYPHGRLMVMAGNVLLYDGPNPLEIEQVFPFVEYNHYRVTRRFWGYGDTALLKSAQRVADKTMAQALDYMRLAANGPLEVPQEIEAYAALGNRPGQVIQGPAAFIGLARYITPQGFDVRMLQVVDQINMMDFNRVGGVSGVNEGTLPAAATSGVEVEARQRAASTRIGQHLKRLNQARSDLADMVWQVMNQLYIGERIYYDPDPSSEVGAIALDVSMLPRGVRVKITADPDDIRKDENTGQNLAMAIKGGDLMNPMLVPFLDIYLRALGLSNSDAEEMRRRALMLAGLMPQVPVGGPTGGDPNQEQPPGGEAPSGEAPQLNSDQAFAAEGM